MTAPDAAADARALGPDRTAALVAAAVVEAMRDDSRNLEAAARRLAAPPVASPQWPERVWAVFGEDGKIACVSIYGAGQFPADRVVPARLVPADGSRVVLSREDVEALRKHAEHEAICDFPLKPCHDLCGLTDLLARLDAALAASAPTEDTR